LREEHPVPDFQVCVKTSLGTIGRGSVFLQSG